MRPHLIVPGKSHRRPGTDHESGVSEGPGGCLLYHISSAFRTHWVKSSFQGMTPHGPEHPDFALVFSRRGELELVAKEVI